MDLEQNLTKVNANEVNQALQKFEWDNAAGGVKNPEAFVKTIWTLYQGREFLKDPERVFADVGRIGENQEVWKLVYGGLMDTDADSTLTQQKKVLAMQTYLGLAKILGIGQAVPVIGTQMADLEAKYAVKSEPIEPDTTQDIERENKRIEALLAKSPFDCSLEELAERKKIISQRTEDIEDIWEKSQDYARNVSRPAAELAGRLLAYENLPDGTFRSKTNTEIDELVTRARTGDQVARDILGEIKSLLIKRKANTQPLPNLEWEEKSIEERAREKRPYQVISQEEIDSLLASLTQGAASSATPVSPSEVTPKATTPKVDTTLTSSHQDQDAGEIEKRRIEALLAKNPWDCNPEERDERAKIWVQRAEAQTNNPTQADLEAAQADTDRMAEDFARKTAEPAAQRAATPEPPRPEIITLGPGDLVKQVKEALEARKNSKRLLLEVTPEVVTEYLKTLKIPVKKMWGKTIYATMQDSSTAEIVGNQLVIYGEISAGKGEGPFGGGAKFIVKLENNPSGIGVQPINFDPDNPEHLLLTGQAQGRKEKIVEAIPHLNETIIEQLNGQLKEQKLESWQLKDFRIDIDKGKLTFDAQR